MKTVTEDQQDEHTLTLPERWLTRIEDWGIGIADAALALIMMIVVIDVAMRYLFNSPLRWSYDLLSLFLIPTVFFFSLAQTLRRGEHIAVDFFANLMPAWLSQFVLRIGLVAAAASAALLAYVLGDEALHSTLAQETAFGYYIWPIWIPKVVAAIGVLVLTLRVLVSVLRQPRADAPREGE